MITLLEQPLHIRISTVAEGDLRCWPDDSSMIQSLHPLDGITREPLYLQQVHGDVIHFRPRGQAGDGLVTDQAGDTLLLFTADCPILLYHFPGTAILAGVHAG